MGPLLVAASTVMLIIAVGVSLALVGFLAAEPPAFDVAGLRLRLSRSVRRSFLIPMGFVAFAIVSSGQLQGQGAVPATSVEPGLPRSGGLSDDMVARLVSQGGATAILMVVLWFYRRDFFRKDEARQAEIMLLRDEKAMLASVIRENAKAMQDQAVATLANTKATELLAQNVNNLADRRSGHRP